MWHIAYRTSEGEIIKYIVSQDYATVSDIDQIALQYFEKTGREPEQVFMDIRWLSKLMHDMAPQMRHTSFNSAPSTVPSITSFWLSIGNVTVVPVSNSYTPILIGSRVEFDDNDINKIFEETVLKDCEREQ